MSEEYIDIGFCGTRDFDRGTAIAEFSIDIDGVRLDINVEISDLDIEVDAEVNNGGHIYTRAVLNRRAAIRIKK